MCRYASQLSEYLNKEDVNVQIREPIERVSVQVASELSVSVQVGGGIRTEADIAYYLEAGVERVILGSIAVQICALF